jgi:hypothetical protein
MAPSKNRSSKEIKIDFDSKYPLVPLASISIVERPTDGEEKLFFNPRGLSSFTPERMEQLQYSIRTDGLQQPPIVRAVADNEKIVDVELIAGERRLRSLKAICENDLPCFDDETKKPHHFDAGDVVLCRGRFGTVVKQQDESVFIDFEDDCIGSKERKKCDYEDVFPTVSGRELYESVPCKVIQKCSDQRALRLAFTENDQSEPLTIAEEIALVRRLEQMELRQEEIAEMLGSNVTWVSQTSNFEEQLPDKAFDKLIKGEMARHVAVHLLSYPSKDREALFNASIAVEEEETATKIRTLRQEKERLEDEEELYLADAKKAEKMGDEKIAKRARRKADSLATKAEKTAERLKRAKEDKGVIKQGHVKKGAVIGGLQPRKAKTLDKADIETTFIHGMADFLDGTGTCDQTGETIPEDYAAIVHRTAMAIISGVRDPIQPIRDYMVELGHWEVAESVEEEVEAEAEADAEFSDDDMDGENFDEESDIEAYSDEEDEDYDE